MHGPFLDLRLVKLLELTIGPLPLLVVTKHLGLLAPVVGPLPLLLRAELLGLAGQGWLDELDGLRLLQVLLYKLDVAEDVEQLPLLLLDVVGRGGHEDQSRHQEDEGDDGDDGREHQEDLASVVVGGGLREPLLHPGREIQGGDHEEEGQQTEDASNGIQMAPEPLGVVFLNTDT